MPFSLAEYVLTFCPPSSSLYTRMWLQQQIRLYLPLPSCFEQKKPIVPTGDFPKQAAAAGKSNFLLPPSNLLAVLLERVVTCTRTFAYEEEYGKLCGREKKPQSRILSSLCPPTNFLHCTAYQRENHKYLTKKVLSFPSKTKHMQQNLQMSMRCKSTKSFITL